MRRYSPMLLLLGLLGLFSISCDATDDESGTVTLMGQVLDSETSEPVPGAFVRILANPAFDKDPDLDILIETDDEGRFTVEVKLDFTADLVLVASDDAYNQSRRTILAIADRTIEVPTFRLNRVVEEEPESGTPSNILLLGVTNVTIGVIESGSDEVSRITFQVADSAGSPVTLNDQTLVRFSLGQQPGGGEFIAPAEAPTDNSGKVTVNLSSGTRAGVVQVIAETDVIEPDGSQRTIRSKPVAVTIHGGLPDQAHFTVGPSQFNFPGLIAFGIKDPIGVIVGDKWSNPVRPGTAVYFNTTHGVIEGSIQTNEGGAGSVDLISGNPFPVPPDSRGVAIVHAETAGNIDPDDNGQQRVTTFFPVLFSGFIVIGIDPPSARLNQTYTLTVTDVLGNPLAPGTDIRVRAEGTKVKAVGNTEVELDDTGFIVLDNLGLPSSYQAITGVGITQFIFRAVEDLRIDEGGTPTLETITILVSGPNGRLEVVLTAGGAMTRTVGATIETLSDGNVVISAPQQ
ncbi:MAG: hypothetical protein IH820_16160 [Bacteroidetes bacterium]|nr:hypothetical protein [Bacteroidota bacterium]